MTKFESRPAPADVPFSPSVRVREPTDRAAEQPAPRPPGAISFGSAPWLHTVSRPEFDIVVLLDAEGRFRFVSGSAERVLGYSAQRAIGHDVFALFDGASASAVRATFRDLVARRRLSACIEMQAVAADGSLVELEAVAVNHLRDPLNGILVSVRDVTERNRVLRPFEEGDEFQSVVIDSLADGVLLVDADGTVLRVNEAFEVMFEAPRIRMIGHRLADVFALAGDTGIELLDADGARFGPGDHPLEPCLREGRRLVGMVFGVRRPGRQTLWVRLNAQAIRSTDGAIAGAVISTIDITGVREATDELHRSQQFLQVLLDTLEEGILACDAEGRMTVFNPAARWLHGLPDDADPIGMLPTTRGLWRPDGSELAPSEHPLLLAMSGERFRDLEILLAAEEGELRKVSVNGQALVDDQGRLLGAVVAMHDVTEQKLNEERLAELAMHDPLTGLANRTLLAERLQEAIDGLARRPSDTGIGQGPGVAVFLLDLDEFKEINDALGHDVGDDMLVAVARRLLAIVRPSDTVARLGGDEFVVVCDIENGEEEMLRISERISTALARPYRIEGRTLTAVASVGGVFADNPDTDPSKLLSRADDAMYGVKWSRRRARRSMTD